MTNPLLAPQIKSKLDISSKTFEKNKSNVKEIREDRRTS